MFNENAKLKGGKAFRITGNNTIGSTLSVIMSSGWTATAYQWTRDSVDISGATSSTYTLVTADALTFISCRVTAFNPNVGVLTGDLPPIQVVAGGNKPYGNSLYLSDNAGVKTNFAKTEAEAPFTHVRIWVGNKTVSGGLPTFKAVVGATDNMLTSSVDLCFVPRVNGVFYNAIKGGNPGGYAEILWGGATSYAQPGYAPALTKPIFHASDWVECASLPRVDNVGARPAAVWRVENSNAAGRISKTDTGRVTAPMRTEFWGQSAEAFFRPTVMYGPMNNQAVTSLALKPPSAESPPAFIGMLTWLEFKYLLPCRTVLFCGDSTMESAAAMRTASSWVSAAMAELSTQSNPVNAVNLSGSGHTQEEFIAMANAALDAGLVPTDAVLMGWSQNGFIATPQGTADFIARNRVLIDRLRAIGTKVFLTTAYTTNGYATGEDRETGRQACITEARNLATQGLVTLVDTDPIITDYVTIAPVTRIKAAYDSGDNVHANAAGQRLLADALKAVWV